MKTLILYGVEWLYDGDEFLMEKWCYEEGMNCNNCLDYVCNQCRKDEIWMELKEKEDENEQIQTNTNRNRNANKTNVSKL